MDYKAFRRWQEKVPDGTLRLDDLNIYDVSLPLTAESKSKNTIDAQDWINLKLLSNKSEDDKVYCVEGLGIRDLLNRFFHFFRENTTIKKIALPEDVYPVYFDIAEQFFSDVIPFKTYSSLNVSKIQDTSIVMLIPNPLTPVGRYLTPTEIQQLKDWLAMYSTRHILVDACYNFSAQYLIKEIMSERLVELVSVSKLWLKPAERGWALSRSKYEGFDEMSCPTLALSPVDLPDQLSNLFSLAWQKICPVLETLPVNWHMPESGYLSLVNMNSNTLLEKYNIAAVPASVFGSDEGDISIISCIAQAKRLLVLK